MGKWNVRNRRLARRLAGSDEWDEFESKVAARPLPGGLGNEDVFCTDYGGGFVGMSFRFFDPDSEHVVDLLGGQPAAGPARPAGDRLVHRRHGHLRGSGHVRRTPDPRALHLVGRHDADAALGAGVLGRRRRDLGDELDHGLHAGSGGAIVSALERTGERRGGLPPRREDRARRAEPRARRDRAQVVRRRSGRRAGAAGDPGSLRAAACATRARSGELGDLGELGFVVLHRCGESFYFLLVCTWRNENELWETVWAKDGDERRLLPAVADRGSASPDLLRVGARRRLPRTARMDALSSALRAT